MVNLRARYRILLVDDHDSFRQSTAELLRLLGHRVVAVASPLEALALFQRKAHVELLITDLRMPQVDGLELASRVLALCPGLAVLLISSHAPSAEALSLAGGFLLKPFAAETLQAEIERLLGDGSDQQRSFLRM